MVFPSGLPVQSRLLAQVVEPPEPPTPLPAVPPEAPPVELPPLLEPAMPPEALPPEPPLPLAPPLVPRKPLSSEPPQPAIKTKLATPPHHVAHRRRWLIAFSHFELLAQGSA